MDLVRSRRLAGLNVAKRNLIGTEHVIILRLTLIPVSPPHYSRQPHVKVKPPAPSNHRMPSFESPNGLSSSCVLFSPDGPSCRPATQNGSLGRAFHFTVHVFLSHDPSIARVLLPDLFLDFPDSAWKLPPLVEPPQRPREKPVYKSLPRENWSAREVLGRYVFSEPLAGEATLLQLAERVEQEFAIPRKYQGQFTIFPQNQDETGQYPLWDNRPLPWSTTLAEVHQFDLGAFKPGDNGPTAEDAPVLHLVLETKAAALMRIVGPEFLEKEIGEPYRLFVGYWYCLDTFWHFFTRRRQFSSSQLESNLSLWRGARFAYAYLVRQEEKGLSGPYHDELRTSVQRVEELREKERLGGLSDKACWDLNYELRILLSRISHIERNKANGHDQLRHISVFVTQWEDWITNRDFQSLAIRLLEPGEVESKVASVFRQARELVDEWRLSEGRRQLQASIE